jgi:hypothetical protein
MSRRFVFALLLLLLIPGTVHAQPEPTRAPPQPAWYDSALRFVPAGFVAGYVIRADDTQGILPIFPANADDPKTPASSFDHGQVLVVTLARQGDAVEAVAATLRRREPSDVGAPHGSVGAEYMRQLDELNREVAAKAATLPPDTMPCDLHAFSIDRDPKGLNVRAEPSVKARVLGTLPPPFKARHGEVEMPAAGWPTEFTIIGYRDGWFLIEGATPPGKRYERPDERRRFNYPKPYAGRGWVAGNKVGANYANGATRMGGLFQAPHVDARWTPAQRRQGDEIGPDGGPKRIFACGGMWGLVESYDGVRGWWRALCSDQVTNCS